MSPRGCRGDRDDEYLRADPPDCGVAAVAPETAPSCDRNVSSGLAFVPMAVTPTYCATKAAIHSYTQSLRYQLRDTSVQVLELIPPYVQTELSGTPPANDPNAIG